MSGTRFTVGCAAMLSLALVSAAPPDDGEPAERPVDTMLERAGAGGSALMLSDHVTTQVGENHRDLVITTASGVDGTPETVTLRSGTTRVFRAAPGEDDFTKAGGWRWRCGKTEGETRFVRKSAFDGGLGPLVMVVYQLDGTVHWYRMTLDLRC